MPVPSRLHRRPSGLGPIEEKDCEVDLRRRQRGRGPYRGHPFQLDSKAPSIPVADFVGSESRFAILARTDPERATELLALQQADVDERWRYYEQLGAMARIVPHGDADRSDADPEIHTDEVAR
jgi:hypothetical protein